MTFTITALLAVFVLLTVTSVVYLLAQKLHVPYTVLLVATGLVVLYPLSTLPLFSFLSDFSLSYELLFYIFLPVLIFEASYAIDTRRLRENLITIASLSIVSLVLSAFIIASALYLLLPFAGVSAPFILCLLFGTLISATDPVAVLALFKEYGAPRRLTLLFEGESIFNDGTAVALFLVVLAIATGGFHGAGSFLEGGMHFATMVLGGVLFGLVLGFVFARAIGFARQSEFVQITLMLVLAHLTFIVTEIITTQVFFFGYDIHLSSIIATAVASMVVGNYGRAKITPRAEEFVEKFWAQTAFIANSLVFVLLGLIFVTLPVRLQDLVLPIVLAVVVVAAARALSVYPVLTTLNILRFEEHIPRAWQHLLAWGSLRGIVAVIMVIIIPDTLTLSGWTETYSPKEFILGITIGCIFATLFLKATTIAGLMRRLGVSGFTPIEVLEFNESRSLVHERVLERLKELCRRGHISEELLEALQQEHTERLQEWTHSCAQELAAAQGLVTEADLGERVLRMYTIGFERQVVRELYTYGEVNERVYRAISRKLDRQYDAQDMQTGLRSSSQTETRAERLFYTLRAYIAPEYRPLTLIDRYAYYRTQNVLARAVVRKLTRMRRKATQHIFGEHAFTHILNTYERYLHRSAEKMNACMAEERDACVQEAERVARHSILRIEEQTLEELAERRMISPKINVVLRDQLTAEAQQLHEHEGEVQKHT